METTTDIQDTSEGKKRVAATITSASVASTVLSFRQLIFCDDGVGGNIDCLGLRTWRAIFIR